LRMVSDGSVIVGVSAEEATLELSSALLTLREFGVDVVDVEYRGSFAFIAQKGYPDKTVLSKAIGEIESYRTPARVHAIITGSLSLYRVLQDRCHHALRCLIINCAFVIQGRI